jgi:sodium/proline symporter
MSTADSLLLLASSAVVRDTIQKIFGSQKSDQQLAGYGKIATLLIGIFGVILVFQVEEETIFDLVLVAWSGLGSAFGPVVLCLLYYKGTSRAGVAAGMLAGFVTNAVWVLWIKDHTYGLYEALPGFIVGVMATLLVSKLTYKNEGSNG